MFAMIPEMGVLITRQELWTGNIPYHSRNSNSLVYGLARTSLPELPEVGRPAFQHSDYRDEVLDIVRISCDREPNRRPSTATLVQMM